MVTPWAWAGTLFCHVCLTPIGVCIQSAALREKKIIESSLILPSYTSFFWGKPEAFPVFSTA